ncbi:PREDICTED: G2/mitotic-specific cyclin-B-like [Priapulus caudatus]|uniref:G2/mitotic-specific cyclin-B-like n=1 Tax=Priapulus caudatus TaxID=37621 RepID=A0ABM1DVW7_PRICU|nr:PREDICTED: G2/mitotic-specific cyclin-B-like [Priapulus caudatus]
MALNLQRRALSSMSSNTGRENVGILKGKAGTQRTIATGSTRQALDNVSNAYTTSTAGQDGKKKVAADHGTFKPRKGLVKSRATSSLIPVKEEKEITKKTVKKEKPASLLPVDISCLKLDDFTLPPGIMDIDTEDNDNPQLVSTYVNEIYMYLRFQEQLFPVKSKYLEKHTNLNGRMRGILVDWLIQVHNRFHLLQETLYLTIDLLDRFLQEITDVTRDKLQLVGVTAMLIASKYEEMYAPEVNDFVYITDNAYSSAEIRKMEVFMLKTLSFNMGKPLCLHFLRRNSKAGGVDAQMHTLAKYLLELMLPEYEFIHYNPSQRAAAALYLAVLLINGNACWNETLAFYSGYTQDELSILISKLASLVTKSETAKLQFVRTKYTSSKFMKISTIPELQSSVLTELAAQRL